MDRFTVHNEDGRWAVKLAEFNLVCNDVAEADQLAADLNAATNPIRALIAAEKKGDQS